jgi:hypothetical protein
MKPLFKVSSSPEIWSGKNYVVTKTTSGIIDDWYYLAAREGKFSGAYRTFEEAVNAEEAKEVAPHVNAGT